MRDAVRQCASYFRQRPAYHRMLKLLLAKYRSYGKPSGTIRLSDAAPEECDAARALFGRPFYPPLTFKSEEFEAALQQTPYRGVTLRDLLEEYFHTSIQTRREQRSQLEGELARAVAQAREGCRSQLCLGWLDELTRRRGSGYSLVQKAVSEDPDQAARALLQVCRSIQWLEEHPGENVRLAVLSANATSDPHALDADTLSGKLLLHLLALRSNQSHPESAERRDALCYANGILCDSISSSVTLVGVRLFGQEGEHPGYQVFRTRREICTLTLTNLSALYRADSPSGKVFLVENQMVFSQLCDRASRFHSPLICTSGQPQVAVLRLLDLLYASGTQLYYSGDFDGKGLSIALQLWSRYPGRLHFWHMTPADYLRCRSQVPVSEASRTLLRGCDATPLAGLASDILEQGLAGYQELLLPELEQDLIP